jgi:transglutaminase-like putative cysteine protease
VRPTTEPLLAVVARSLLAFVATYVTLLSWRGLSEQSSAFLLPLFWAGLLLLLGGALARAFGAPAVAVAVGQLVLVALWLTNGLVSGTAVAGWVPTGRSFQAVGQLLQRSVETANSWAAPIPAIDAPSFAPLMVVAGVVVFLLVDFFLGVARRAPLVGLPLLAAFTAPVSVLRGVSWVVFCVAALAFLLMLAVDQALRLSRWGSALPAAEGAAVASTGAAGAHGGAPGGVPGAVVDDQPHRVQVGTLWPAASRLAVAGVGLAVITPALLPATSGLFNPGPGTGPGEGSLSLQNPLVDMRRDLSRGEDVPMVIVRTDDPAPAYLRLTVLDSFDGQAWRPSERELPREQRVVGELPPPPGLEATTQVARQPASISVMPDFNTTWLPTPYPVESVSVAGDWRYDISTRDILSSDPDVDAGGLDYDVVGLDLDPDPRQLVESPPVPQPIYVPMTDLPSDLPSFVPELARQVTEDGRSQFERAVMLQDWFRQDGGFTYSLERDPGSGYDEIRQFLGTGEDSRTGYCEQFASAMAIMARSIGVPARVAVGFLRPEPQADGSWVYSSHDLHSWPELYFEGAGWIRFEPTPPVQTDTAPAYTRVAIPAPATAGPTGQVQDDPIRPLPDSSVKDRSAPESTASTVESGPSPWLLLIPGAALLLAIAAAPRVLRGWIRRRRLADDAPPEERIEGAWDELRATALDLSLGWDDGDTLRQRARGLAPSLAGDPRALRILETVVLGVERSRFSRQGVAGPAVDAVVSGVVEVCASLEQSVSDRSRRRAAVLPASLWRGRRRQVAATGPGSGNGSDGGSSRRNETEMVSV